MAGGKEVPTAMWGGCRPTAPVKEEKVMNIIARAVAAAAFLMAGAEVHAETLRMWGPEQITEPLIAELWNAGSMDGCEFA